MHADDWAAAYRLHGIQGGRGLGNIEHGIEEFGLACQNTPVDFEGLQHMAIIVLCRKYDVPIFEPRIATIGGWYEP